jgi:hypothetical protein
MHAKHPLIDSPRQAISNGRWHTTWFLTVEELFPLKDEAPKYGQEAPDLRSRSYKLALKSSKGEKVVANKKLQVGSRSSKEGAWKGINTH